MVGHCGVGMRLDRRLSRNLGWTRTEVAAALKQGRITAEDGTDLDPRDSAVRAVLVDEATVELVDHAVILQHKPVDVVSALSDREHATAYALLAEAPLHRDLRAIGRLDRDTTGLLLWTDDGDLVHRLTHPKNKVERTYQAALIRPYRAVPSDFALADGHTPGIAGVREIGRDDCHPALIVPEEATVFAEIRLTSGAYHEVRRIFAALGSHVLGLCRTGHGDYTLPAELEPGGWRIVHAA